MQIHRHKICLHNFLTQKQNQIKIFETRLFKPLASLWSASLASAAASFSGSLAWILAFIMVVESCSCWKRNPLTSSSKVTVNWSQIKYHLPRIHGENMLWESCKNSNPQWYAIRFSSSYLIYYVECTCYFSILFRQTIYKYFLTSFGI